MEDQIVGEGAIGIHELAKAMEKSKAFVTLVKNWKRFGAYLEVKDVKLLDIERRLKLGDVQLDMIPREIIKTWKAKRGTSATLKNLHEALVEFGAEDIAETLMMRFCKTESMRILTFLWQDEVVTLEELLGENISQETYGKIFDEAKKCFPQKPIPILKDQLIPHTRPKYYIPRTLFYVPSTEIDKKIFTSESAKDCVFLFKGVQKHDIARLSGFEAVGLSGDNLHDVSVSFMVLESDGDFDRICKKTTKPVHLIKHEDGRYFWMQSNNNLELIRQFLKEGGKHIDEQEFVAKISSITPPRAFSIADSPGMGKTLVLASLATEERVYKSINLFIVLQEFTQHNTVPVNSSSSALEAIATYTSSNQITKLTMMEMLKVYQLNLYFDGYDEVKQDKLDTVDFFLNQLQKLKNVKVIVTTRPHLQARLEVTFNQFSYQIRRFSESNQIEFLIKYWIDQHDAKEGESLWEFAKQCLIALQTTLTDKENEIAGIPLQTMVLAEVYGEDAKRASNMDIVRDNIVKPLSLFEMYRKLVERKLMRGPSPNYANNHVRETISLLFPNWVNTFKRFLDGHDKVDEDILYAIGLLEKSPNQNTPWFVHRTFAEYLLAEFIVNNLSKQDCVNLLFGEILGRRGTNQVISLHDYEKRVLYNETKYPVIAYFIDLHLREYTKHRALEELRPSKFLALYFKFSLEDVCRAAGACCKHNLECAFDYVTLVLRSCSIWSSSVRDKYFQHLPYSVIRYTHNVSLLHQVLEYTKLRFGIVHLSYHDLGKSMKNYSGATWKWNDWSNVKFTPLHLAVIEGKYNFATYLAKRYESENRIHDFQFLLHLCAKDSYKSDKPVIEEKSLIIDMLAEINPSWLEEKTLEDQSTPLLAGNVHLSLLKCLVKHGADINAVSSDNASILHKLSRNIDKDHCLDVVRWALSNGFNLINHKSNESPQFTALMWIILVCRSVDDEVLKLLQQVGADFNAVDNCGNSVFLQVLKYTGRVDFIGKLLMYGAVVIMQKGPWDDFQYNDERLLIIKMLTRLYHDWLNREDTVEGIYPIFLQLFVEHSADINLYLRIYGTVPHSSCALPTEDTMTINKFIDDVRREYSDVLNIITDANQIKETPLMIAEQNFRTFIHVDVINLFLKAGADLNVQDENGDSVLFYALENSRDVDLIKRLLEYGVHVNHTNHQKQNAVHKVNNGRWNSEQISTLIKMLESKGFKG